MAHKTTQVDELLTPAEAARIFGVHAKTVSRWADAGRLSAVRTMGGHRRYRASEVRALMRTQWSTDAVTAG